MQQKEQYLKSIYVCNVDIIDFPIFEDFETEAETEAEENE